MGSQTSQETIHSGEENISVQKNLEMLGEKYHAAGLLLKQGKLDDALRTFEEVYEPLKVILDENHPDVLSCRRQIAVTLRQLGRCDESLEIHHEVFVKLRHAFGPDNLETLKAHFSMAHVLLAQGKNEEALQTYWQVLKICKVTFGDAHPATLMAIDTIGDVLSLRGKYKEALEQQLQALKIEVEALGKDHPLTMATKKKVAGLLGETERYDEALAFYKEILAMEEASSDPDIFSTQLSIAQLLHRHQKKHDVALNICRKVLRTLEARLGKEHEDAAVAKFVAAEILASQGKHPEALRMFREISKSGDKAIALIGGPEKLDESSYVSWEIVNSVLKAVKRRDKEHRWSNNKVFLEHDGDVDTADDDGRPISNHYVEMDCNAKFVETLLASQADVTLTNKYGYITMLVSVSKWIYSLGAAAESLSRDRSTNKLNDYVNAKHPQTGTTGLHAAANSGSLGIIKSILKHGAIYDIRNAKGETPHDVAARNGHVNASRFLKTLDELFEDARKGNKAKIAERLEGMRDNELAVVLNARNSEGYTLLHVAILHEHEDISC